MKQDGFNEKISWGRTLIIGFQHVLTMCPGTIAVQIFCDFGVQ